MSSDLEKISRNLHSAMIKILRELAKEDILSGVSPARLSILSVLNFIGEKTLSELSKIEKVTPPTMTALVQAMEKEGFILRKKSLIDKRTQKIKISSKGKKILLKAQKKRLDKLVLLLKAISPQKTKILSDASDILLEMTRIS